MNEAVSRKSVLLATESRAQPRMDPSDLVLAGVIGDTVVTFVGFVLSSWLRFATPLAHYGVTAGAIKWTGYFDHAIIGSLLYLLLLPHRQMHGVHQILRFRLLAPQIIKAALTWLLVFMALSWMVRDAREISRLYVVIAFCVTTTLFLGWRFAFSRLARRDSFTQRLRQRILFVGWSGAARTLAQTILTGGHHPYEIVGYVPVSTGRKKSSPPVILRQLGTPRGIAGVLQENDINMVVLGDLNISAEETLALANLCEKEMVSFKVIPDCFQILLSCLRLQTVSGVPVLGLSDFPLENPINVMFKQVIDIIGGTVGAALSAPIIAVFGLLVYLESPGPLVYSQQRLGRDGRPFRIFKIRSMRPDAEAGGTVGWTTKDDPRRLRIGTFMRRWNIDELPQFWNVLRGEMSLVGPRPERPELIRIFKEEIPHYSARHNMKPGITGWAQVNGFRGDTDLRERIRCDLYYIENWSLFLDLEIMAMTLLKPKNAA